MKDLYQISKYYSLLGLKKFLLCSGPAPQSTSVNYRLVPTQVDTVNFMSTEDVEKQQEELQCSFARNEGVSAASAGEATCLVCLVNKPTRVCVPCGHLILCRICLTDFINRQIFHSVTTANGEILTTHIRLPITCVSCRAIVGQIIQVF